MIKVKVNTIDTDIIRQTPGRNGTWGKYTFFINDDTTECDYWFVFYGIENPVTVKCAPENTYFVGGEPTSTAKFRKNFLHQFHNLISSQNRDYGMPYVRKFTPLRWSVGSKLVNGKLLPEQDKDYDELKNMSRVPKTKLLSVISSFKTLTPLHKKRLEFAKQLKNVFGDAIDLYGLGINTFEDTWDAIAPYKYHIALENSREENYFSEKLMNTYLAETYPIYYGCANIDDYYPAESMTKIDIEKPEEAIAVIKEVLASDPYEERYPYIKQAKELTLDKYNLFAILAEEMDKNPGKKIPQEITVWPTRKCKRLARLKRFILGA
ncbi:MAG: hypothetical protein IJ849_05900 [Selenomonadaceae bacterium]|nr:hypothetical protein [Selenomonadaceae bacterium]